MTVKLLTMNNVQKNLKNFEFLYEDFYDSIPSIYSPLFDYIRIEINSIICVFFWNYPLF